MTQDSEITAEAYWMTAKRIKFAADLPAGCVIKSPETGKSLSSHRYPTEKAALDDAARVLAEHNARVQQHAARTAEQAQPGRRHAEVNNSAFGVGRVYEDQPGATQYDDGSGRYRVQIWDNS